MASEGYSSRASCDNGIASVQKNCGSDDRYERKTSASGDFRFNLKAGNGQVIGVSQGYSSEASRDNGIQSVMTNGSSTEVDDQT